MKFTVKYPKDKHIIGVEEGSGKIIFDNDESEEIESLINDYAGFFAAGLAGIENMPAADLKNSGYIDLGGEEEPLAEENGIEEAPAEENAEQAEAAENKPNMFEKSQDYFNELMHIAQRKLDQKRDLLRQEKQEEEAKELPGDKDPETEQREKEEKLRNIDKEIDAVETEKIKIRTEAAEFNTGRIEMMYHLALAYQQAKDPAKKAAYWKQFAGSLSWITSMNMNVYKGKESFMEAHVSFKTVLDRVLRNSGQYDKLTDERLKFLTDVCHFMDKAVTKAESMERYCQGLKQLNKDVKNLDLRKDIVVEQTNDVLDRAERLGLDLNDLDGSIEKINEDHKKKQTEYNDFLAKKNKSRDIQKQLDRINEDIAKLDKEIDKKQNKISVGLDGSKKNPYCGTEIIGPNSEYRKLYKKLTDKKAVNDKKISMIKALPKLEASKAELDAFMMQHEQDVKDYKESSYITDYIQNAQVISNYLSMMNEAKFKETLNAVRKVQLGKTEPTEAEQSLFAAFRAFSDNITSLFGDVMYKDSRTQAEDQKTKREFDEALKQCSIASFDPKKSPEEFSAAYRKLTDMGDKVTKKLETLLISYNQKIVPRMIEIKQAGEIVVKEDSVSKKLETIRIARVKKGDSVKDLQKENKKADEALIELANKYLENIGEKISDGKVPSVEELRTRIKDAVRTDNKAVQALMKRKSELEKQRLPLEEELERIKNFDDTLDDLKDEMDLAADKLYKANKVKTLVSDLVNNYNFLIQDKTYTIDKSETYFPKHLNIQSAANILGEYSLKVFDGKKPGHDDTRAFLNMKDALHNAAMHFQDTDDSLGSSPEKKYKALTDLKKSVKAYIKAKNDQWWILSPSSQRKQRLRFANDLQDYCGSLINAIDKENKALYNTAQKTEQAKEKFANVYQRVTEENIYEAMRGFDKNLDERIKTLSEIQIKKNSEKAMGTIKDEMKKKVEVKEIKSKDEALVKKTTARRPKLEKPEPVKKPSKEAPVLQ